MKTIVKTAGLLLVILLFLSGCTQNESREEGTEQNNFYVPEFSFETVLLQSDRTDMYVKLSEYSEPGCEELFQQICNDIDLITSKTGCTGKRVVLCMADSATVNYYAVESVELYCTSQQIVNGDYRCRLLEEMYDLHDYGTLTGLCSYLFTDDREKEAVNLADYYADPAHLPVLSLFAAYFNEAFADDETVTAAEETARQFVGYILDTYGMERVLSCGFSEEDRTEWLRSIGVSETYHNVYETDFLEEVIYRDSNQYPLILRCGAHRYNFVPITGFSTPEEVWQALSQYDAGVHHMLAYIRENASSSYDRVLANWQAPLITTFGNQVSGESAGHINIGRLTDWLHETAHFLLERQQEKDGIWTQEGMTTYLSCFAEETLAGDIYYTLLTLDYAQFDESESKDIALWLADYYHKHWAQERYNQLTYFRGWGIFPDTADLPVPEEFNVIIKSCADRRNEISGGNYANQDGNDLTYFQAMLVLDYLSEQFGFDNVMDYFFNDTGFNEQFGMEYTEAVKKADDFFE